MSKTFIKIRKDALSSHAIVTAGFIGRTDYLLGAAEKFAIEASLDERSRENEYRILVFDDTATCLWDTGKLEIGKILIIPEVINALSGTDSQNLKPFGNIIYAACGIKDESSQTVGAVLLVASADDVFRPIADIEHGLIYFAAVILVIITAFVYFISGLYITPLRSIMKAVIKMSQGRLDIRTGIKGKDEFAEMGRAFNLMADELEVVEKTRAEFVSNVSHELKTPLSSIKVLTESILLETNVPTETYVEFLTDINSEIDRMTFIINDLLNLVKLDRRGVILDFKPVDISLMIMDILKRLFPVAHRKNIHIAYEEIRKITAFADEAKLSSAILNIVDNAVKYTPDGGVVKVTTDADSQKFYITVTDTGIGISEDEQQKIFGRFYRVDKTRDRETGGTGLGLAITHATILLHNGGIRVVSRENEGSTFIVSLPLYQSAEKGD